MKKLEGKTVVIVGASGGIGSALAKEFHAIGANVVLSARKLEDLLETERSIGTNSSRILVAPADATDLLSVRTLLEKARKKFGSVDVVIMSAGRHDFLYPTEPAEKAINQIEKHFRSIFLPSFLVSFATNEAYRKWGKPKGGLLIVNISSQAAIRPELSGGKSYGPMKAASTFLMRSWKYDAEAGVRIMDLQPGTVNTPGNSEYLNTEKKRKDAVQPRTIFNFILRNFGKKYSEKFFASKAKLG